MSPKSSDEVGASQTSPVGTEGSKRRVVRSRENGVAAAQAWGEHDAGYETARDTGALESAEQLGESALEAGRGLEHAEDDPVGLLDEPVSHQAGGHDRVVVRPYRAVW